MARRRKKTFPCGHKGYGRVCHRCEQDKQEAQKLDELRAQKQQEKREWEATFDSDPIDLRSLPPHVVLKARSIVSGLNGDSTYRDFGGKRLRHDRQVISIPVTRHYRMICHDDGDFVIPKSVLSHEDYNVKKPGS